MPSTAASVTTLHNPNLFEFRDHVWGGQPALVTGAMTDWPAASRWTHAYLRDAVVRDQRALPLFHAATARDTMHPLAHQLPMAEVMDRLYGAGTPAPAGEGPLFYLKQQPLQDFPGLLRDVRRPPFYGSAIVEVNLWIGSAGCWSPLHFDYTDNVMCQVAGRRRVRLYSPAQGRALYAAYAAPAGAAPETPPHFSLIGDVRDVDLSRFPAFAGTEPAADVVLGPGEMFYIPPYWWHFVEILDGPAILVNFWYALQFGLPLRPEQQQRETAALQTLRELLDHADSARRGALAHVIRNLCEPSGQTPD